MFYFEYVVDLYCIYGVYIFDGFGVFDVNDLVGWWWWYVNVGIEVGD